MRSLRTLLALACASGALLVGAGAPAYGAAPEGQPATSAAATSSYLFGYYYTLDACQYFGNSLVQGGAFSSYYCQYQYHQYDQASYWYLYVW